MIRQANRADLAACARVIRASFQTVADTFGLTEKNAPRFTAFALTENELAFQMEKEARLMYLDEEDGEICGFFSLLLCGRGTCELSSLSVLPAFRHRGIGGALLRHAAQEARGQGCKEMLLSIVEENEKLKTWYEQNGAVHTGTKKFDFFPFTCGYMRMKLTEKSCGAVVFRRGPGEPRYLLIREHNGFWGFPKGHTEEGESERDTALREIKEETGLSISLIEGFRRENCHPLAREGCPNTMKQTVYFLGYFEDQPVTLQEKEIAEAKLMDFASALEALEIDSLRQILMEAHLFLAEDHS